MDIKVYFASIENNFDLRRSSYYFGQMQKPPLVYSLIGSFSNRERIDFRSYLAGRKDRLRPAVLALGNLITQTPDGDPNEIYLHTQKKISPKKNFSIHQLHSWLYQEAKLFLLANLANGNELPLVEEFSKRGLLDQRNRLLNRLKKEYAKAPTNYRQEFELLRTEERYTPRSRTSEHSFQVLSDTLDLDFLVEKLRWACSMQSHENVFKVKYDLGLLRLLLPHLDANGWLKVPLVAAYYHAFKFLNNPNAPHHYHSFQQILEQQSSSFNLTDQRELYLLGINYLIRRVNQGDTSAGDSALRLYKEGLKKGIFLKSGNLSPQTYRNAVALAIAVRDFIWAENFIAQYSSLLPRDQQQDLRHYNLARLAHAKGDNDVALEELRYLRPKDKLFLLSSEVFRAKIYYEQSAFELLDKHLDKMSSYLKRHKIGYHATNYAAFIKYCRKLSRLNHYDKDTIRQFSIEIERTPVLTEKKWLLGQLQNLQ